MDHNDNAANRGNQDANRVVCAGDRAAPKSDQAALQAVQRPKSITS